MNTIKITIMTLGITFLSLHGMLPNQKLEALSNELNPIEYLLHGDQYIEKFNTQVYTALEYAGQLHVLLAQLKESSTASELNKKGYHSFTQEFMNDQAADLKKFHEWTIYFHKVRLSNQTTTKLHQPNQIRLLATIQRNSEARALIDSIKILLKKQHITYTPFNPKIQKQLADLAAAQSITANSIGHLLQNPQIRNQPAAIEECNQIIGTLQEEYEKLHTAFHTLAQLRLTNKSEYEEACDDTGAAIIATIDTWFQEKRPQIEQKLSELKSNAH